MRFMRRVSRRIFSRWISRPASLPFGGFLTKSLLPPGRWIFNLTHAEAQELAACIQKRSDPQKVSECVARLLLGRASAFQREGLDGAQPYEMGGGSISRRCNCAPCCANNSWSPTNFRQSLGKSGCSETKPYRRWYRSTTGPSLTLITMERSVWGRYINWRWGIIFSSWIWSITSAGTTTPRPRFLKSGRLNSRKTRGARMAR